MVAVDDLDIDSGIRHPARDLSELSRHILSQLLREDLANIEHLDPNVFERASSSFAIFEKKMHIALSVDDPTAAAFDAHTGSSECFAHPRHLTGLFSSLIETSYM
jgi:hypothetical protein